MLLPSAAAHAALNGPSRRDGHRRARPAVRRSTNRHRRPKSTRRPTPCAPCCCCHQSAAAHAA
eukprot:4727751-Prymnesium_polylepis.1